MKYVYIILLLPKNVDILKIWSWMKLISKLIFAPLQAPRTKRAKPKISAPSKISSHPNPSAPLSISFGWHDKTPRKPSVRRFVDVTDLEIPDSCTAQCIKRIKLIAPRWCTNYLQFFDTILTRNCQVKTWHYVTPPAQGRQRLRRQPGGYALKNWCRHLWVAWVRNPTVGRKPKKILVASWCKPTGFKGWAF